MARIAFVGAGSVTFTRMLLTDLFSHSALATVTIALHDIDPERLATAEAIARRVACTAGAAPRIEAHLDRRAAIAGADYVINMIQVGGHEATVRDHRIPAAYGLRQTIGDTLGIGGIFRALRTIPVMRAIAADMAELCPDAWLLNYTNPMAMVCWATYGASSHQRVVGLCHSVPNTVDKLAALVGVPAKEVSFLAAGVNHQAFLLRFEHEGKDLYPRLDEAIDRDPELARTVRVELYRRLGYFPSESSEHSAEYLPWFMRRDDDIDHFRIEPGSYVAMSEENLAEYRETRRLLAEDAPLPADEGPAGSANEYAPQIILAMETGHSRAIYANVENNGLIDNLPGGACVEVPCVVDKTGVRPLSVGTMPPQLAALNRTFLNVCELTVRAAVHGRREHVYHAAMLDPNTAATLSLPDIRRLCDSLIAAHGDLMPDGVRTVGAHR
ncbi:alpha-glucosidase/alpha-galactosidase [Solihabitans fulvus]|uniref:Alpha-glucosidase/alpha-galactosidase n=1 Tax=Solihabitans fulvus TaxID=1892852 RepID=A0A5B2XWC5_9PSEU|nr:alpha-glucosidase/alpha-galactosidase [Solihabitans fulvus]KAA2267011.1 alpha-glucosidase/alpha-galactosidase [Solihabitans fulvus]